MPPDAADHTPHAVVICGRHRLLLAPEKALTFGRGRANRLRIGHEPEDSGVPRSAGRLECRPDGVLVHNTSDKVELIIRPVPGPEYPVELCGVAGTQPHGLVKVVVKGRLGEYEITVDTRALRASARAQPVPAGGRKTSGFERIRRMSRRDRMVLSALCLPLLIRVGPRAEVPTYAEVAATLRTHGHPVSRATVRKRLDDLRTWLTHEHGIDGLVGDGAETSGRPPVYVQRLARWAVVSGNVTTKDLDNLDRADDDLDADQDGRIDRP
jgi:hypothetical protein